ncbi:hypothetical protein E8E13_000780 [Curvularia kusanoi]|uniref:Amidase domain-containing protein n=1 Tax=Curvularia kusanoi TaxID=90978 RepID=A0A9P4T3G9_CURKU|nr:hypothetical protein E8E13_000780 [Curvularia kusanoi]
MAATHPSQVTSIVEASIADLAAALSEGRVNSVELTAKHLLRIAKYDRRSINLNAVPILNEHAFDTAQASDDRRAAGKILNALDGIPCTIKDSYKIKGMTVASGSPAFRNLVANEDAFTVLKIKEAGAVILGKTNMPPMAAGGMQRGVYGRAESPYNAEYLTAAFASGSSNGSATATASSFGLFGMGEETISSGRSPASNNGLVAYTPSRGLISIRGNWPLFPTCDTVVPHTRSVADMFALLNVIVAKDERTDCDFWRGQPFVKLPDVDEVRPQDYHKLANPGALSGKKIGVPKMYIGGADADPSARKVHTRQSVIELWHNARAVLESQGAEIFEVDFPVVTKFEASNNPAEESTAPPHHNEMDMCQLMAFAWDDFLASNGDAQVATSLAQIASASIFPPPKNSVPDKYDSGDPLVRHTDVVAHITPDRVPTYKMANLGPALQNLEAKRKATFEDWLGAQGLDAVVFPCNGDVGRADADVNEKSAAEAWRNGVLYSNGNCAIRQLGIPTISVPMGIMSDIGMPVNLTFAGRAYGDSDLLEYAWAFENGKIMRQKPTRVPELPSDRIEGRERIMEQGSTAPKLAASASRIESGVMISGACDGNELDALQVFVDGDEVHGVKITGDAWEVIATDALSEWTGRSEEQGVPDPNKTMIIVLARGKNGRSTGAMLFV